MESLYGMYGFLAEALENVFLLKVSDQKLLCQALWRYMAVINSVDMDA